MQPSDFRKIRNKPVRSFFTDDNSDNLERMALVFDTHIVEVSISDTGWLKVEILKLKGQAK